MLRTISRGLIMWSSIVPSLEWILSNVPNSIVDLCLKRPSDAHPVNTDYETINQAYCNITSGAALVLGMRFAGSCNKGAFEAVYAHLLKLLAISKRSVAELAGQATIEQTICVHVLALAVVMAGSGDLEVIRVIRDGNLKFLRLFTFENCAANEKLMPTQNQLTKALIKIQ